MERMNTLFRKIMAIVFLSMTVMPLMAQTTLTFMGKDANGQPVQLDSVRVSNLSRGWTEVLYASDLTLTMTNSGVEQHDLQPVLSQNVPNPFNGITDFSVQLMKSGMVNIAIFTLKGEKVAHLSQNLGAGCHTYRIQLSKPQTYLLNVQIGKESSSIKMVNTGNAGVDQIHYVGNRDLETDLLKSGRGSTDELFVLGDTLSFIGFSTIAGAVCTSMTVTKQILSSQTIELQFTEADVFVCGTSLVFDYDGNVYNTVQMGTQCWMRENMKTTHFADGTEIPAPYAWPYEYTPARFENMDPDIFGYLYNMAAAKHFADKEDSVMVQGVCPNGWHLPNVSEWDMMLNYVSSNSQYHCNGNAANTAKALGATQYWMSASEQCAVGHDLATNNLTGFTILPSGEIELHNGQCTNFWTASYAGLTPNGAYYQSNTLELMYFQSALEHGTESHNDMLSVRCLRNY